MMSFIHNFWRTHEDPFFILDRCCSRMTHRKGRHYAIAAWKRVWGHVNVPILLEAIALAESMAEGEIKLRQTRVMLDKLHDEFTQQVFSLQSGNYALFHATAYTLNHYGRSSAVGVIYYSLKHRGSPPGLLNQVFLANLLRDVYHPCLPELDPQILSWNDRTVLRLAETIYAEEEFGRIPVLGDALEEAGCTNAEILEHAHSSKPHVKGCWLVDLILGKK